MPCYATTSIRVDLGKVSETILAGALQRAGYTQRGGIWERTDATVYRAQDGAVIMTVRRGDATALRDELSRAVSREVIHAASRQFRWTLRETRDGIELTKQSVGSRQ